MTGTKPVEPYVGKCEMCGKEELLLPYGPNSENICGKCGQKDLGAVATHLVAELDAFLGITRSVN